MIKIKKFLEYHAITKFSTLPYTVEKIQLKKIYEENKTENNPPSVLTGKNGGLLYYQNTKFSPLACYIGRKENVKIDVDFWQKAKEQIAKIDFTNL